MPEIGEVLNGRYALRAIIDSGATADVYLGDDLRLGRQVAVKVLAIDRRGDPARAIERFRREAQAAAALSHPHIVGVYDWGIAGETAFLVMRYVAGADLRRVLRERGRLAEATALRLAAEVASALEVAHRHGIVHRDVKPRNVLVDADGSALLADFGIAAPTSGHAEDAADAVYGTALYVSPEQVQGLAVDGRSDVYSLGVLLYELLTGRTPFRAASAGEVARLHISAPVVPPRRWCSEISAAAEAIVLRAVAKEPSARFPNAGEMERALRAAADQPAPAAEPISGGGGQPETDHAGAGVRTRGVRWSRAGWPRLLAALAVLGVLALIGVPALARARAASVPDLAGLPLADAREAAAAAGLSLSTDEQPTQDTPAGVVVTQDPRPPARASAGSAVHVVVSRGVTVPDLTGEQCGTARAALAQAGWSVKPVRWRVANAPDFGKVVAQDPAAGAVVDTKGQISVQVAGPVRPC